MAITEETGLPLIPEHQATGEVAAMYEEIRRVLQSPAVPSYLQALGESPPMLKLYWELVKVFYSTITLPESLVSMILYTIAVSNECKYCSASHELTCRTLGVDESTLAALVNDLGTVSPERVRAIIEFALRVSHDPQTLRHENYDRLRQEGVTDAEILEVIMIAAIGNLNDTLADALKVDVEPEVKAALNR